LEIAAPVNIAGVFGAKETFHLTHGDAGDDFGGAGIDPQSMPP
jgi:hypothetical protein